jgi:DNA-binding XRE family transcriptional regulator
VIVAALAIAAVGLYTIGLWDWASQFQHKRGTYGEQQALIERYRHIFQTAEIPNKTALIELTNGELRAQRDDHLRWSRLREQRGMTQEELAAKAGISLPYLARLETAKQDPTLSTLEKLAKALGVKVERLLEEAPR